MRMLMRAMAETRPIPWDTVVMVGAGTGARLPALRALHASRLFLVEPDPGQRETLENVVDAERGEHVVAAALVEEGLPNAVLHLCSVPSFNGLSAPSGLLEVLPNVEVAGHVQVPACSLRALVAEHGLDESRQNLLILDAPGQLDVLEDVAGLAFFSDIVVRAGIEALYRDDRGGKAWRQWLLAAGFELSARDPEAPYPFQVEAYRRNAALLETRRLGAELQAANEQAQQASMREAEATRKAGDLEAALSSLRDEVAQAREQARGEAEQWREREARNAEAIAELEAALSAARENVAQGQARISEMETIGRTLEQEKNELVRNLNEQAAERDTSARKSEEQEKKLVELKQRLQDLDGQLRNARDTMALAVRMQTLRENDLEELRQRYSELHGAHQSQQALLAKLSRRLVAANQYFQQLAGDATRVIEPVAAPRATAAAKPRKRKVGARSERKK